jgi:hypothetical protein
MVKQVYFSKFIHFCQPIGVLHTLDFMEVGGTLVDLEETVSTEQQEPVCKQDEQVKLTQRQG